MSKRISFGLVFSPSSEYKSIERILSTYGQVKFINYDDFRTAIDILVIPHKVGIFPNANAFIRGRGLIAVSDKKVCNRVSRFMATTYVKYAEANYPIIGIGDGAANIWNELGQKLDYVGNKLVCVAPSQEKLSSIDYQLDEMGLVTRFKIGSICGFMNPQDPNLFKTIRVMLDAARNGELENDVEEFGI